MDKEAGNALLTFESDMSPKSLHHTMSRPTDLSSLRMPAASDVDFKPVPEGLVASVHVVRAGEILVPTSRLMARPPIDGPASIPLPVFAFVITHPSGRRVVFDLGLKADISLYSPDILEFVASTMPSTPPRADVAHLLVDAGMDLASVEAVVFSHAHFDHTGTIALFPSSTSLIHGPGGLSCLPGYPENPNASPITVDIAPTDRSVRELGVSDKWVHVGAFRGVDYFGDGSFHILDAPGVSLTGPPRDLDLDLTDRQHMRGHLTALVRTSTAPDTFLLLGGDAAHMRGLYSCPCSMTVGIFDGACMHADLAVAYDTMAKVARMEQEDNICVVLSHDKEWAEVLGAGWQVADISDWKAKGYKDKVADAEQAAR